MKKGDTLPDVTFKTRVRDDSIEDVNPYRWEDKTTSDYFSKKRVVIFGLPGAFTPTCSTFQLPDFETLHPEFLATGIDAIYCISVNDAFVMNAWRKNQQLQNVEVIPDGSGTFTSNIGMLVKKDNLGFGNRSWRYALIANDCVVEQFFPEPSMSDNHPDDPYEISSPQNVLQWCRNHPTIGVE